MIDSIFIPNRGEIALRIIRACKELGIESIIGYSEADKNSYPVKYADRKVCIGSALSSHSYLNVNNIISAATGASCHAIHPGVGFLSENADFARQVEKSGIVFIGPHPDTIALVGDKVSAKKAAKKAGVPCIPGSEGIVDTVAEVHEFTRKHGFPIIIKAASGGGGKGMRVVEEASQIDSNFNLATIEAEKSFSDGRVYIERYIANPRHVEVQLIADGFSNVVHIGERDCTVQKNHQKLIEESPSPSISDELRNKMYAAAVSLFRLIGYKNVGTIEFLVEDNEFYFMEVNARIQVEHPVSELVGGVDLIQEQIMVASEKSLSFSQEDIVFNGYAMECRINALTPGMIEYLNVPGGHGVRIDTWIEQGCTIPPFYDSLLIKLLVHAQNRREGIQKMLRALSELRIEGKGLLCNKEWFNKILNDKIFRSGKYSIKYLDETKVLERE